ncbi:MAG: hypothetical protein D6744_00235, partial [Planctomycetota bacterium]
MSRDRGAENTAGTAAARLLAGGRESSSMINKSTIRIGACGIAFAVLTPLLVAGQVVQEPPPAAMPGDEVPVSKSLERSAIGAVIPQAGVLETLAPQANGATLAWIGALVVLVLVFQGRGVLRLTNLDVLSVAALGLLLLFRDHLGLVPGTSHTAQWWAYAILTALCAYWVVRGLNLMSAKHAPRPSTNLSESSLTILVAVGLALCCVRIVTAPVSDASRDGLLGGMCLAETGRLPYGDLEGASRSPLLYLVHAGAVRIAPPMLEAGDRTVTPSWSNRHEWLGEHWEQTLDMTAVRVVNAALFLLIFMGVAGIGHRMHSVAMGQTLCAILCFFPGTFEALNRPEVLLPAALITWSVALLRVPVAGAALSTACAVLAGVAWPWAWLMLPVLLGHALARGWNALGGLIGLAGAAAAAVVGVVAWTAPTLPRPDGALAAAAMQPEYTATRSTDGVIVIEKYGRNDNVQPTLKSRIWKALLERENLTLRDVEVRAALPTGIDASQILLRRIDADRAAAPALAAAYREHFAALPPLDRGAAALRTVLEATWLSSSTPATYKGAWELWAGSSSLSENAWRWIRRSGKIVGVLFSLIALVALARKSSPQHRHTVGALLVVVAMALALRHSGAVSDHLLLLPVLLATLAAHDPQPTVTVQRAGRSRAEAEPVAPRGAA